MYARVLASSRYALELVRRTIMRLVRCAVMKLTKKLKIALDETRMLVLGVQILIGFQFRSVFEKTFDQLPELSRLLNGLALLLMIFALCLLITAGPYHRIVEDGNASGRFHGLVGLLAGFAVAPFAAGLALDVGIVGERMWGASIGVIAGVLVGLLAVFFWYGLEGWRMRTVGREERAMTEMQRHQIERPKLEEKIDQMLTEARIILPGVQALLGFQLAIVLTEQFEKLSPGLQTTHGAALLLIALSIVLLMAPAAYHRIVYNGEAATEFHQTGSRFVMWSTVPLALGLTADVFVVGTKIVASTAAVAAIAIAVLACLVGFWHLLPVLARGQKESGGATTMRRNASSH